jgi:hypothetical protein
MLTSDPFAHRTNPNGTIDSICKKCFATVCAHCESKDVCLVNEAKHVCNPWTLKVIEAVRAKAEVAKQSN